MDNTWLFNFICNYSYYWIFVFPVMTRKMNWQMTNPLINHRQKLPSLLMKQPRNKEDKQLASILNYRLMRLTLWNAWLEPNTLRNIH